MSNKSDFVFKPRARLLLQLGDQLIKNEAIAVLELVKNSYDADASFAKVEMVNIDRPEEGKIVIIDDGIGMDLQIIEDVWLEPGSDHKKKKFENRERSPKYGRLPIGEKGIGRFGVHKLGKEIKMITRKEEKKEYVVNIDWEEFAKGNRYLDKIPIDISEREPQLFSNGESGTKIIITKLRQEWSRGRVRKLYKSLFALNSPFKEKDAFKTKLIIQDDDKKDWLEGLIKFDEIKKFALYYFEAIIEGDKVKNFYYKFMPWETMHKVKSREIGNDHEFVEKTRRLEVNLDRNDQEIGEITFKGYIFDHDQTILSKIESGSKRQFKKYLRNNGGIRVYRDNIRVNEYGEKDNDWLNLDISRVNVPGKKISNNQILGIINLKRDDSTSLIEKTNREGFVENEAYDDFKNAILYVLEDLVLPLRNTDKSIIREKYNKTSVSEPVIDRIADFRSVVDSKVEDEETKEELQDLLEKIETEYEEITDILLTSAGAGLSLGMVLHEIEKIISELNHAVEKENIPGKILKLARRLAELVESYGDILRQSEQDEFNLKKLVEGALFNIEYRLEAHDIEIFNNIENKEYDDIIASKRLVLSSIMNVMDNSIHWLEQKESQLEQVENYTKKLYIDIISDEEGYLKLLIADNGKGFTIPKDRIIKPFVSEKRNGMGLGMHIANEVMKILKGGLEFPEFGDYEMPEEFKSGASVIFKFKKSNK